MFAFDLNDSAFSAPQLNAPRPCKHASNCYYNGAGGCAFVHPGEEGTGFKIFPARITVTNGKETWQKATVRLIGGAKFYERRRLKMSWPQWCALSKNSKQEPKLTPSVEAFFAAAAKQAAVTSAPAAPLQVNFSELNATDRWRAMFQNGYAADTPEILAARAAFMASFSPEARALNEKAIQEMRRQQVGNTLYALIEPFLSANEPEMKAENIWNPKMTAGKITAILLDSLDHEECVYLTQNKAALEERLADACELILASD